MVGFNATNTIALILNIVAGLMFIGPPGSQYIVLYLTVPVGLILSGIGLLIIADAKKLLLLGISFMALTALTFTPVLFGKSSGEEMKSIGQVAFSIAIPIQIFLIYIANKRFKLEK